MPAHKNDGIAIATRCRCGLANIVLYGTFGLLMFGPLAFGAVEPWSIFVLESRIRSLDAHSGSQSNGSMTN